MLRREGRRSKSVYMLDMMRLRQRRSPGTGAPADKDSLTHCTASHRQRSKQRATHWVCFCPLQAPQSLDFACELLT